MEFVEAEADLYDNYITKANGGKVNGIDLLTFEAPATRPWYYSLLGSK